MAPLQLFPSFIYLVTLLTTPLLAKKAHRPPNTCPTITEFTTPTSCPPTTPSVCPQPDCILVSPITVPCGCPTTIPTSAVVTPCPTACAGTCGTYISTVLPPQCRPSTSSVKKIPSVSTPPPPPPQPPKPTPTPTATQTLQAQPDSCKTITATEGPACWTEGCPFTFSRCERTGSLTLSCGCTAVETVTSCLRNCDGGCWTSWQTAYLPCPITPGTVIATNRAVPTRSY